MKISIKKRVLVLVVTALVTQHSVSAFPDGEFFSNASAKVKSFVLELWNHKGTVALGTKTKFGGLSLVIGTGILGKYTYNKYQAYIHSKQNETIPTEVKSEVTPDKDSNPADEDLSKMLMGDIIGWGATVPIKPIVIDPKEYPELTKFIEKYKCSANDTQNKHYHYSKPNQIDRIINAERMRKIIEHNKLDHLRVADKCLYICPDNELNVLSKNINPKRNRPRDQKLSLTEVQQLVTLAENTGFRDWVGNFDWDSNGKLAFYDTENDAFKIGRIRGVEGMELPAHCKFNFIASLAVYRASMEPAAQKWFDKKLSEVLNSEEGKMAAPMLPFNTQYDKDCGIDFEQVKKEYNELKKA